MQIIHLNISATLVITPEAVHMAREGGRATLGFGRFIFHTEDEGYQHLSDRTFFGRGQLFMGLDNRLYISYGVREVVF
ncbi:hypothetical protein PENSOL_c006G04335 [Penicillium solitum]|uniref:Uncharacterized protein n=1 Tax=Penicillium solitum TaxID=60172 RepID=A0A1V6RDN3_9EURO|nr:uncharacterized protein PENSOL_c006G04335 [Penicillium solitum]OQD99397.1 hypothetical protein PENSOL_c006G04335 [Penicillium solitum]